MVLNPLKIQKKFIFNIFYRQVRFAIFLFEFCKSFLFGISRVILPEFCIGKKGDKITKK
jgi:hypothetical protein